jgi:hypothetical protein
MGARFRSHVCRLPRRRGRAAIIAALVAWVGGLGALIVAGAVGPVVALALIAVGIPDASSADRKKDGEAAAPKQSVITPAIIMLTFFFMLLGLSNAGIGNFGVVALMSGYGVSFPAANIALTAFLGASAAGVLAGGYLATHRAPRPGRRRLLWHQRRHHAGDCDDRPAVGDTDVSHGGCGIFGRRDRSVP